VSEPFAIPAAIAEQSLDLCDLELCAARLMDDARYPWIVLIPRRAGLSEIEQLSVGERALLIEESVLAGQAVRAIGEAVGRPVEKLNIASLGNVTRALHVHVVGRRTDDFSWPSPSFGLGVSSPWLAQREAVRKTALAVLQARRPDPA